MSKNVLSFPTKEEKADKWCKVEVFGGIQHVIGIFYFPMDSRDDYNHMVTSLNKFFDLYSLPEWFFPFMVSISFRYSYITQEEYLSELQD